jgi:hypothetical protein
MNLPFVSHHSNSSDPNEPTILIDFGAFSSLSRINVGAGIEVTRGFDNPK